MSKYTIGVIGALGAVGEQMRDILADSSINIGEVRMFERPELEGETAEFAGEEVTCEVPTRDNLSECDLATMSAGSDASKKLAPAAADAGCVIVDNSSQWRLDPELAGPGASLMDIGVYPLNTARFLLERDPIAA
ncbi:MAG: hypothetical protein ABEI54_01550, partial [Candidatus Bipolaricaulia bacterium]